MLIFKTSPWLIDHFGIVIRSSYEYKAGNQIYLSFINHDSFSVQELQGKSKQRTGQKWQERSACWTWNRWKINFISIKANLLIEFWWIIFGLRLTFWLMLHPLHKTGLRGSDPADQMIKVVYSSLQFLCLVANLHFSVSYQPRRVYCVKKACREKKLFAQTSSKDH